MSSIGFLFNVIFDILQNVLLGSEYLVGLAIIMFFGYLSLKFRLAFNQWAVWLLPTIGILAYYSFFPAWSLPTTIIVYGLIFALGWIYIFTRR